MGCLICNRFKGRWPIHSRAEFDKHEGNRSHLVPKFTWKELTSSANACYCCDILLNGSRGCLKLHNIDISDIQHCSLRFYYPSHIEDVDVADCDKDLIFHLTGGRRFEVEVFATEDDDCPVPDAWDYMATSKRTSPGTESKAALDTLKVWISDCISDHADSLCNSPELPCLPKRVVDVGRDNANLRLLETNGAKAKYICLSHCWGPTQIIRTMMATLDEHKKRIAWTDLSRTFQDAITLTRTLGFQYIWIDSLCIIQDSVSDWEEESAKMASIYSDGHLTIAATRSAHGGGGLFSTTSDVTVSGASPEGQDYCLYFRERIDHQIDAGFETGEFAPTERYYPLLTRAWVYQERMLSTRVLHFGRYELFFECKSSIRCECEAIAFHGAGKETPVPLIKIEYADVIEDLQAQREGQAPADVQYQAARLWRTLVACYTILRLTKSQDRLPAISGLAKQLSTGRKSRYLAGLWEDSLSVDLLWEVYTTSAFLQPRPHPRNAPTWSWASVETFVGYWDVIMFTDIEGNIADEQPPFEHFSVVEQCRVMRSATSKNEFGSVESGQLTISGLVAEGLLEREVVMHAGRERIVHYVAFPKERLRMNADYLLDCEGPYQTNPGAVVFCLRMSLMQEGGKEYLISLVLKESPVSPGYMERIGSLKTAESIGTTDPAGGVFCKAKRRTVVIV